MSGEEGKSWREIMRAREDRIRDQAAERSQKYLKKKTGGRPLMATTSMSSTDNMCANLRAPQSLHCQTRALN